MTGADIGTRVTKTATEDSIADTIVHTFIQPNEAAAFHTKNECSKEEAKMDNRIEQLKKRRIKAIIYIAISIIGMIAGAIIGSGISDLDQPFGLFLGLIVGCAILTWAKTFILGIFDFVKETLLSMFGQGQVLSAIFRLIGMIFVIAVKSIFWALKSLYSNVKEIIDTTKEIKSCQELN